MQGYLHLKIQDKEFDFFMQVINNFSFVEVENNFNDNLTEEQRTELDKRYYEIEAGTSKTVSSDVINKILQ